MLDAQQPLWSYLEGFDTPVESYEAFEFFRDAGPRARSFRSTAVALRIPEATVGRWAREKLWLERAQAYDAHRIEQRAALLAARDQETDEAWAERRADALRKLEQLALEGLDRMIADMRKRGHVLRPNELRMLVHEYFHQGNLAHGEATERVEMPFDLSHHTDDQLLAARETLAAMRTDKKE